MIGMTGKHSIEISKSGIRSGPWNVVDVFSQKSSQVQESSVAQLIRLSEIECVVEQLSPGYGMNLTEASSEQSISN